MMMRNIFERQVSARAGLAGTIYGAVVAGLCLIALWSFGDLFRRFAMRTEQAEFLARLQQRAGSLGADTQAWPPGSPFLDGQTETTASASLLQRVINAVTQAGGNLLSSEVDRSAPRSGQDYLRVTATCDIDEVGLQRLLYDLEAGMPFLFVDLLVVHNRPNDGGRLQAQLRVAGRWGGAN